jgi:hypothetical protein
MRLCTVGMIRYYVKAAKKRNPPLSKSLMKYNQVRQLKAQEVSTTETIHAKDKPASRKALLNQRPALPPPPPGLGPW